MRRCAFILLTLSVLFLTACGGDSGSQKAAPGTPENPLQALPNPEPTRVPPTDETGVASKSKTSAKTDAAASPASIVAAQKRTQAHNERRRAARAKAEAAKANAGEPTSRGPRRQHAAAPSANRPCSLVTKAQARKIVGVPIVEPLEAPQGPTCIYQSKAGKQLITLTVLRTTDFARLKAQVRKLHAVSVADHSAVCGSYGQPMLYLPLAGGRLLSIAGACDMASRFAAKAVPHL
jgi:hypothetical protein